MAEPGSKKQKKEEGGPSGLSDEELAEVVEQVSSVQDELEKVNEKASDEILKVEQKYNKERRPIIEKRHKLIEKIPDFWMTVFLSHPVLFSTLTDDDHAVLEFLRGVDVEDFPDIRSGHTITLTFADNPYFEDKTLKKTYKFSDSGTVQIEGTKIQWKPGKDITQKAQNGVDGDKEGKDAKKRTVEELLEQQESFFKWFDVAEGEQEADAVEDEVADIIREEIWPNPLKLYTQEGMEEEEEGEEGEEGDEEGNEDEDGGDEEGEEDVGEEEQ